MELEVRHLRVVCAIAETGSLTRAAAALRMAQPGLTAQLQRVERVLGGPLFTRDRRGAVPTALGNLVLSRARAVLPALDDLKLAATLSSGESLAVLRIGTVNAGFAGALISRLRTTFPEADFTTRAQSCATPLIELVAEGRLEVAVVGDCPGYEIAPRPGVTLLPVHTEPIFALLPADHPLTENSEVDLQDLAAIEWTLPPDDDDRVWEYYTEVFGQAGVEPRIAHQVEGVLVFDLIRSLRVASLCQATCVPPDGVVVRPISRTPLWYRHVLAWNTHGPLAAHADTLAELAHDSYEETATRSPTYGEWRRAQLR